MIGGVLLAAGSSIRFGGDKQLALFEGKTLLRRAAETLTAAALQPVLDPVVVVLGPRAPQHQTELAGLPVSIIINDEVEAGMSRSLSIGLRALGQILESSPAGSHLEAVLVMVCDQPYCTAEHLNALTQAWRSTRRPIAASAYAGTYGVPAVFDASLFPALHLLSGGRGAAQLIRERSGEVAAVEFAQGEVDIDTREDLRKLERRTRDE
jgi:molybdenum cofactor cytidylyltransferase